MSAKPLAKLPEEERYLMAPRWVYDLAEIDPLDAILGTAGTLTAYAVGGVPGIVAWGGAYVVITLVRKTPLIPWTIRTVITWRRDPKVIRGQFRDAVIPAMREDAMEVIYHPQRSNQPQATSHKPEPVYTPPAQPERQPVNKPQQPSVNHPLRTLHHSNVRAYLQQLQSLPKLLALHGRHIVIFGPTGIGKSSIIKHLLRQRQKGLLLICDPHYQPGNWPSRAYVVGKGRNFSEIAEVIQLVVAEMSRRYLLSGEGKLDLEQVEPIYLVMDEMSAMAEQEPEAVKLLMTIAQEGRKAKIFTILTPHGQNVETMGLKGRGEARANFAFIEGQSVTDEFKKFPRIVSVTLGAPKDKESQFLGKFVVPAPQVYSGTPHFGIPRFLGDGVPNALTQGVSSMYLAGVSDEKKPVSQGVSSMYPQSVSVDRYTPGTGYEQRFSVESDETRKLTQHLANQGYGIRKISRFLPFASSEAQDLARETLSEIQFQSQRPAANSEAERKMVRYLHWDCGAPLERIARLLDGNTWENLARIQAYADGHTD